MSRKGQSITLSLREQDKAELEKLACELGMMWGDRPNISKLVEAIARRQLSIAPNNDWTEPRIKALVKAVRALSDAGHIEDAQVIAKLLLERSELSSPLRKEIERFQENLPPAWRFEIEGYIRRQQPFQLSYQDAAERLWSFTVRYAQMTHHEERKYLDCWCEQTTGNQDVEELQHNWSLRLDRITDATISPISGNWLSKLDEILVEMHLLHGLAFAYQAKSEDVTNEWLPDRERVRRVVRRVSSTFWFIREVLRYAPDCVIVSPQSVRQRFKDKLIALYQHYQLEIQD
ncbi:MAG: WYL domain-containing protein [Scytonema hyalinum WJT4-NPBG1]|jgi:predicted DNA-binding transcriptional regulator YafY|nr:WYL domain-containing protein [Scytonema hyalinum WJT4-NPBG1]